MRTAAGGGRCAGAGGSGISSRFPGLGGGAEKMHQRPRASPVLSGVDGPAGFSGWTAPRGYPCPLSTGAQQGLAEHVRAVRVDWR